MTPPYMSYQRFESFIASLHGRTLPPRIDRTLMQRMSGGEQSQVRIALRFLGLTQGDDNLVTETFRALVLAYTLPTVPPAQQTEDWKQKLAAIVKSAYGPIIDGLDDAATQGQLDERFRTRGGLAGSSLVKAVRFFLAIAGEAGITMSPYFKGSTVPSASNGERSKRTKKPRDPSQDAPLKDKDTILDQKIPVEMEEVSVPVPGKTVKVWFPKNLSQKEFDYVINTLKAWRDLKEV